MKTKQLRNLFAGASEEQLNEIKRQDKIEEAYMQFVRQNPGLPIEKYEAKYKALNSNQLQ